MVVKYIKKLRTDGIELRYLMKTNPSFFVLELAILFIAVDIKIFRNIYINKQCEIGNKWSSDVVCVSHHPK
jgi:hypothetical protein